MKVSIITVFTVAVLSMIVLASPVLSQQPQQPQKPLEPGQQPPKALPPQPPQQSCGLMTGKPVTVSGTIDFISTYNPPQVIYHMRSQGLPCISDAFIIVDPNGPARCREGLKITASGILQQTVSGAQLVSSFYTCQ
jgi:hypothetical protein